MSKEKNKHLIKSIVPQHDPNKNKEEKKSYINEDVTKLNDIEEDGDQKNIFVSLRFVEHSHQCFSDWSKTQMKAYWDFQVKAHNYTWQQVKDQATKNPKNKTGLAYTHIPSEKYPKDGIRIELSPDTTFFELRVNSAIRVHGFRSKAIFYICWLDKDHKICA